MECYDFKTLYTNIHVPHDDLFDKICCLIDMIFDSKSVGFIKVSETLKSVSWSQDFKNYGFCMSKSEVKEGRFGLISQRHSRSASSPTKKKKKKKKKK